MLSLLQYLLGFGDSVNEDKVGMHDTILIPSSMSTKHMHTRECMLCGEYFELAKPVSL